MHEGLFPLKQAKYEPNNSATTHGLARKKPYDGATSSGRISYDHAPNDLRTSGLRSLEAADSMIEQVPPS
jgi:hypothetical protein